MSDRYFNTVFKTEVLSPGPDVVVLPPENIFWGDIPDDHELTYDMNGIPNGSVAVPPPAMGTVDAVRLELYALNITRDTVTRALYLDHLGDGSLLATLDATVATVAANQGVTQGFVAGSIP